jgi:hypothetical protein
LETIPAKWFQIEQNSEKQTNNLPPLPQPFITNNSWRTSCLQHDKTGDKKMPPREGSLKFNFNLGEIVKQSPKALWNHNCQIKTLIMAMKNFYGRRI